MGNGVAHHGVTVSHRLACNWSDRTKESAGEGEDFVLGCHLWRKAAETIGSGKVPRFESPRRPVIFSRMIVESERGSCAVALNFNINDQTTVELAPGGFGIIEIADALHLLPPFLDVLGGPVFLVRAPMKFFFGRVLYSLVWRSIWASRRAMAKRGWPSRIVAGKGGRRFLGRCRRRVAAHGAVTADLGHHLLLRGFQGRDALPGFHQIVAFPDFFRGRQRCRRNVVFLGIAAAIEIGLGLGLGILGAPGVFAVHQHHVQGPFRHFGEGVGIGEVDAQHHGVDRKGDADSQRHFRCAQIIAARRPGAPGN